VSKIEIERKEPAPALHHRLRVGLPLTLMLAILVVSSIPGTETDAPSLLQRLSPTWQNLLHIPAYAALTLSWFWALTPLINSVRRSASVSVSITVLFALLDEYNQSTVPGRTDSLLDVALDAVGVVLALLIIVIWRETR